MQKEKHIDPVCGMEVEHEEFSFEFDGKRYFFCSQGCLDRFQASSSQFAPKQIYDLIIIGGGPAGLTAAVYASVLKIDTFFITSDIGGQAIDTSKIKNYMGFDFISGPMLINKFKDQFLKEHYLSHKIDRVVKLERMNNIFEITTLEQQKLLARAVIVASGMKKRKLSIPGEDRLQRKGICYSSVHDIDMFKGSNVSVVGGGNSGVQTAHDLQQIGCNVTLITMGKMIADPKNIEKIKDNVKIIEEHIITEIQGEDSVEGISIKSEQTGETIYIPCKGVFIQVGFLPNTEFCKDLVNLNEKGEIIIDAECSTSTEGLFACGDVTNVYKRIIIASGEGAKAVLSAKKYLLDKMNQLIESESKKNTT
nr:FAD-dependent oxidoreductase [uncultured Carboxylicivirga sp.]